MSRSFNRSVDKLLGIEGGFSDHPEDTGGKTNYGITEELARTYEYEGDMEDIPLEFAKEIYKQEFWDGNHLQEIAELDERVAFEVFEFAVNAGSDDAVECLQRSLNALNYSEDFYSDIEVDGIVGEETLGAWNKFHEHRSIGGVDRVVILQKALNCLQGAYYVKLTEEYDSYESFITGWFNKRVKI